MIKPIKNARRINAAKKIPEANPAWAEAFMILLLAKVGGKASLSLDRLHAFVGIKGKSAIEIAYDQETKNVTIQLSEELFKKAEEPKIITFDKNIIT